MQFYHYKFSFFGGLNYKFTMGGWVEGPCPCLRLLKQWKFLLFTCLCFRIMIFYF